jgi:hypothetical protein
MLLSIVYMLQDPAKREAQELLREVVKDGQYYPIPRVGELVNTGQVLGSVKLVEYQYARNAARTIVVVLIPVQN